VEDVVAVCVELDDGDRCYFVTWGRIQDAVDPLPLQELILRHAGSFSLGGEPVTARVCETMREAAMSESAPYFFESFLSFASTAIPFGDGYERWRAERAAAMSAGREIRYCGQPRRA
jgi:hypothetical protein